MRRLGNLSEIEYINAADLIGMDDEQTSEALIEELGKMNPVKRQETVKKLITTKIPSQGSRAEFEKHFIELPQHAKENLQQGKLRLADMLIYAIKPVTGHVTKMFKEQDVVQLNITNISKSRLPKNMTLLVSGIYLLQGQAESLEEEALMQTKFTSIESIGAIVNGEISFKVNKKDLLAPGQSNRSFIGGTSKGPIGYHKLDNPRLIPDDTEIELNIELGTIKGIPPNTVLLAGLHGTATIP
ncbi:MAG TPA: hypothetical protein VGN36_03135 [Sphingorhabdus sp.]|nr:hypothetical protein [Sphingorhabdus sp.]